MITASTTKRTRAESDALKAKVDELWSKKEELLRQQRIAIKAANEAFREYRVALADWLTDFDNQGNFIGETK